MTQSYSILNPILPVSQDSIAWTGLHGAALGLAIAESAHQARGPLVIVLEDQHQLELIETEIRYFLDNSANIPILPFPGWECLPYDNFSPNEEIVSGRLRLLASLPSLKQGIVLLQASELMQKLPPVAYVLGHSFTLAIQQSIDIDALRARLVAANYTAVSQVIAPGEYAVRGGLIDVFPMGHPSPFRLDLLDDELESIRLFDPDSQRSGFHVDKIELLPAREFPMTEDSIREFRSRFRQQIEADPRTQTIYTEVSAGRTPPGIEFYLPLFFENTATFFDYLGPDCTLLLSAETSYSLRTNWAVVLDRHANTSIDSSRKTLDPEWMYLTPDETEGNISRFKRIQIMDSTSQDSDWNAGSARNRQFPVNPKQENPYQEMFTHLENTRNRVTIAVETEGRREALEDVLRSGGFRSTVLSSMSEILESETQLNLTVAALERGLNIPAAGLELICESQLYGERVFQRRRRSTQSRDPESIIKSLAELNIGDPVVHIEHGVGRYRGLQVLDVGGEEHEFLTIEYQNEDKLYLPVLSLQLVSRFIGGSPDLAPLHRLGGEQWEKSKNRAREKAYDVAAELLEIEAYRNARKGQEFTPDPTEYVRFCSRFPFEETADQLQVLSEILADLASPEPMDRLVCGDVGFGKTEIALRAAFVVASSGQQVALLAPTTLLAQQHYQTFSDRFADWPVNVSLLSRFRSRKESTATISGLKDGSVDVVIGTHKLLQDETGFRRLGLLIIDEEHRFGVRQKEKIKRMRSQVDILTLTATPIPRTLNITMAGLRSISIIATPPANRLSIKTFVREWNSGLIREACLREIRRGGQIFFLHNDVRTIERMVHELGQLVPEAEIRAGHGQMPEMQLERIMQDFYHQRFNLLVCSTIIESGIDIPSANTIIINRADRFGLAQLHQLRGRVGRSSHQAFAYLLTPPPDQITGNARKRLEAIDSMEDLGAGFALASHDLEIRGAGELLGETQSGSIDDIGFSLYSEYLSQAVRSIREGRLPEPQPEVDVTSGTRVELHIPALFPASYLDNAHTRLVMYKRISNAHDHAELDELQIETIDRFGLLPPQGKNLFQVTAVRLSATRLGISRIEFDEDGGIIEFEDKPAVDPSVVFKLINQSPHIYKLAGPSALRVSRELSKTGDRIEFINALLQHFNDTLADSETIEYRSKENQPEGSVLH